MKSIPIAILSLLLLSYSPPTQACDCAGPGRRFLQTGGEIPANSKGLFYYCPGLEPYNKRAVKNNTAERKLEIVHIENGREQRLDSELVKIYNGLYLLRPKVGLTAGERYRFGFRYGNNGPWHSVEVTVGKQRVWPMKKRARLKIGPLELDALNLAGPTACSETQIACKRAVELVLPPAARKYKQSLLFKTIVDGKPWNPKSSICSDVFPGRSWQELGTDLLFTLYDEKSWLQVLKPGFHRVRMVASMPGIGVIAASGNVKVWLKCRVK